VKITYVPAYNDIQQHQLRQTKPPPLVHFEMRMTIALPLFRPRSSPRTCVRLSIFPVRRGTRFTHSLLRNSGLVHARRIFQDPIVTPCLRDMVHLNPRMTRVHATLPESYKQAAFGIKRLLGNHWKRDCREDKCLRGSQCASHVPLSPRHVSCNRLVVWQAHSAKSGKGPWR
jgi:hypothetical protein